MAAARMLVNAARRFKGVTEVCVLDIFITIGLAIVSAMCGYLGFIVPLEDRSPDELWRLGKVFGVLSLAGLFLVSWQAIRSYHSNETIKKTLLSDAEHPPFLAIMSLPSHTNFVAINSSDYPAYVSLA